MFDWEENVFIGLKALYRQAFVRPDEKRRAAVRVTLKEVRNSLVLLGSMVAGRGVGLFETANPLLCGDDRIFLPAEFSIAPNREANRALFELKTLLGALALRDGWHRNGVPLAGLIDRCRDEFPHLEDRLAALRAELPEGTDLWKTLGELPLLKKASTGSTVAIPIPEPGARSEEPITEIEGQGQTDVSVLPAKDDDGDGADLPMHIFEKIETLEEYTCHSRKSDDEDELDEHAEALSELRMTQVMRSPEAPRSIYRGELILDGTGFDLGGGGAPGTGIPYPEWDFQRQKYRRDWCHVQPQQVTEVRTDWAAKVEIRHRALIHRLRRQFASLTSDWVRLRRQLSGAEFDLDAVIDSEIERRSGHTPGDAVYLDRRRDLHDVAVLLLLDVSYSTDSWMEDRRVLDVITETVFCVGEVLEDYVEKSSIAAFSSNTRRSCRFDVVRRFGEPWRAARPRLGALAPCGYTRMGPALRHAHELLLNETASRKIVFLVTDGRPCDYDRYEGVYGIKDVKKAIETGRQHGIQTHAFAIEKRAAETFPQMFTRHHYDILPHPDALAKTMCRRFARLLAA